MGLKRIEIMRITDLYDLEKEQGIKNKIKEALINDIESLAQVQFKDDKFAKFVIRIKLEKVKKNDDSYYK